MTEEDVQIMARTIFGEARGEIDEGKIAVGWVIRNRAAKYGCSIAEACLKSVHFSCWNNAASNDANQLSMLTANLGERAYARCMVAACQVAYGLVQDPTAGATHYHANYIPPPTWAKDKTGRQLPHVAIGRHLFYTGVA